MTLQEERPLWWALGLSLVPVAGLGVLSWMLWLMHGLAYGATKALGWGSELTPPDTGFYVGAFVLGAAVSFTGAAGLAWLVRRTPVREWPPSVLGLGAALVAGVTGACALLLAHGIDPVDFVGTLW